MRYAVLGVGGVGGLVGGALAKAGHDVTLLVRPGRREHYSERLSVQSELLGNFEAPVRVADWLEEQFDVVWITVKATALEAALSTIPPEVPGRWRFGAATKRRGSRQAAARWVRCRAGLAGDDKGRS